MENWIKLSSAIYYTGVGAVLLGTTIRFLYRLVRGYDQDREFLDELKEVYLADIYKALQQIAEKLDISLDLNPPAR